ncbi:hypothetical protein [Sphingomonas sp. MMS24-J13]|uniref:hypothetical protein n=1 Tax=Sphingomonas sp. MMS24-J13 TaxID=3238686 RepID=UPI00384D0DCB
MSAGEFASLPRTTPTQQGEDAYQAKLRQRRPMPVGPAGFPVPDAKAIFRKTEDAQLLSVIARQAYLAHSRSVLPVAEQERILAELHRLALERFPPADMAVLDRYQLARSWKKVGVEIDAAGGYEKSAVFDLPSPVLAPTAINFRADLGGASSTAPNLPDDITAYFRTFLTLRRDRKRFDDLVAFPGQFRGREGRYPRWFEIERQVPEVGAWLAGQRGEQP